MPFQPNVHDQLTIDGITYRIAEHPAAPGMPYGQEGRAGIVYCLEPSPSPAGRERGPGGEGSKAALKVFKPRFRLPFLVSQADRMAPLAALPGLRACQRIVLTPFRHADLLRQYPDLTYAVLMPWIEGPTWFDILMDRKPLSPETSLALAHSLAQVLARMEEQGIAHCDLSAPNVMLPLLAGGTGVELVDLEGLYAPGMTRPQELSSGSAGYAHRQARGGLWGPEADRFAGAVLLAEMLGWCDPQVVQAAWGESYFAPQEMQQANSRYRALVEALERHWGSHVARLFERAWRSDTLADCPTFGEWMVVLPDSVVSRQPSAVSGYEAAPQESAAAVIRELMQAARQLEKEGNLAGALTVYRQAHSFATAESGLRAELEAIIKMLESRTMSPVSPPEERPEIPSSPEAALDRLFDEALSAYRRAEWSQARELLAEVVRRKPDYEQQGFRTAHDLLVEVEERLARSQRVVPLWAWAVVVLGILVLIGSLVEARRLKQQQQATQATATAVAWKQQALATTEAQATAIAQVQATATARAQATATAQTLATATAQAQATATAQALATATAQAQAAATAQAQATATAQAQATATAQALATATAQARASATAPAQAGRIAFVSERDGNYEIYVMNADGSGLTRLTNNPANDGSPSWSPDGRRIAFQSDRDGNYEIYVMNADGSGLTRLTNNPAPDARPSWSSDGKRIAFDSYRDGNCKIYVINADGSEQTRLMNDPAWDGSTSWSPDRMRIAFASGRDGNPEIYVMNADGSGLTRLTNHPADDMEPSWSPDGKRIAFASNRDGNFEIYVMSADGSGVTRLTNNPASDQDPSWSPDGKRIAFASNRDGNWQIHVNVNWEIYVMNADGSGVTRLTNNPAYDGDPSWSP